MRAPRRVMQQTGRLDQPQPFGRGPPENRRQKGEQLFAKARQPGRSDFRRPRRLDQRVAGFQLVGHLFVQQPLADPVRRDVDLCRAEGADQFAQDLSGQRNKLHPFGRSAGAGAQVCQIIRRDPVQRFDHRFRGHAIFMQNRQRIVAPFHIQTRNRPPRPAHKIKPVAVRLDLVFQRFHDPHNLGPAL